jgi:lysozyme
MDGDPVTGHGIDVSEWQGAIDWPRVAAGGVDFAIIRAGYGLAHADPFFARNSAGAKAAGVHHGAYLWFRASQDPVAQAALLVGASVNDDLAPWCDFETTDGQSAGYAVAQLQRFLDALEGRIGRTPTIYTGPAFWRSLGHVGAGFARYPLALAHYTTAAAPDVPAPWSTWSYWQHSSAGRVPGIAGVVDLDISLTNLLSEAPAQPGAHPMAHLNAPVVGVVRTRSGHGYWEIAADGGVFNFGDAGDAGTWPGGNPLPSTKLVAPVVDGVGTDTDQGLLLVAADGGVFALGDAEFHGSVPALPG